MQQICNKRPMWKVTKWNIWLARTVYKLRNNQLRRLTRTKNGLNKQCNKDFWAFHQNFSFVFLFVNHRCSISLKPLQLEHTFLLCFSFYSLLLSSFSKSMCPWMSLHIFQKWQFSELITKEKTRSASHFNFEIRPFFQKYKCDVEIDQIETNECPLDVRVSTVFNQSVLSWERVMSFRHTASYVCEDIFT